MGKLNLIFTSLAALLLASCSGKQSVEPIDEPEAAQEVDSAPVEAEPGPTDEAAANTQGESPKPEPSTEPTQPESELVLKLFNDDAFRHGYWLEDPPHLESIVVTRQNLPVLDATGSPVLAEDGTPLLEVQEVMELMIHDHNRLYKVGDRIDGTDFEIVEIFQSRLINGRRKSGISMRQVAPREADSEPPEQK